MNVAVYGPRPLPALRSGFALEEHALAPGDRRADGVSIGRSAMRWEGDRLVGDLDERTTPVGVPLRRPLRGRVVLHPEASPALELPIDPRGEHRWWPIAPLARAEVDLPSLGLRFRGHAYHDANAGPVSLDVGFDHWSWSRARTRTGAHLTYDIRTASGANVAHAFRIAPDGAVSRLEGTAPVPLERSAWRLSRLARVDRGHAARTTRVLEDGPFYSRSLIQSRIGGHDVVAMHETLAGHRLRQRWVQFCTAYRMR